MVKFFLKDDKNPPKLSKIHDNNNKDKKKLVKKIADYRIVIWKKLFNLIRNQSVVMIQKLIKKLKDKKRKLQKLGTSEQAKQIKQAESDNQSNQNQGNQTVSQKLNKQISKLDAKFQLSKSIKKQQFVQITLYIISQVLKIENIEKIIQKYNINTSDLLKAPATQEITSVKTKSLKQTVETTQSLKDFIQRLSLQTSYQQELQKCAQLIDLVQQKKVLRKGKLKEKKTKQYLKKHGLDQKSQLQEDSNLVDDNNYSQSQNAINDQPKVKQVKQKKKIIQPIKQVQNKTNLKDNVSKPSKKFQHGDTKFNKQTYGNKDKFSKFNKQRSDSNNGKYNIQRPENNGKYNKQRPSYDKNKPINKFGNQRTEFKKTGRNKVKYEKQQSKERHREGFSTNKNKVNQKRPFMAFKKEDAHPSWQAKQSQKQEVFIKPFQGKKVVF